MISAATGGTSGLFGMVLSDSELQELETKGSEPLWHEVKDGGLGNV